MVYTAVIISDLHLGTRDSKAEEFLRFLDTHTTNLLILNGDIVDGWALSRGSKWKKIHTKVLGRLLKMSNKTRIIWIRGNHDEFLTEFIGSSFGRVEFREDYLLDFIEHNLNGVSVKRSFYIFHGDVIDIFITKYRWLSKIGAVGYDFALWLNRWYNRYRKWRRLPYQSISQKIKEGVKQATAYINDFEATATRMGSKKGCDGVVCGHIHQPQDRIIDGIRYLNSGDWVENLSAILIDSSGQVKLYRSKE